MFKIAICAERGIYHEANNVPCQDAVGKYERDDVAAIVLCDGAGSVTGSEKASNLVCECLPKYLAENFNSLYFEDENKIKTEILNFLVNQSEKESISLDCTMLAVAMNNQGDSVVAHIGDGVILGEYKEEYKAISKPENGAESYITFFLSGELAMDHLRITKEKIDGALLTSDGIADLLYSNNELKKAVPVMLGWLEDSESLIAENKCKNEIDRIFKQYAMDDISVAMILNVKDVQDKKGEEHE